nr:hypothetical protein [Tanacetum cinerariifolium]
ISLSDEEIALDANASSEGTQSSGGPRAMSKLRSALERIVTASGPRFGDCQWRLVTLPFAFGGLGVYLAGDVLNYAFIASRLQSAALQTKLLRYVGIVSSGLTFDDALCVFNTAMEIDFLSIPSVMALWQSQREDHTSDWLRVVSISGLGQTMNGDIYEDHVVLCAGIIGIKHRLNAMRDTLVDMCFRSGISAGKEIDIELGGGSSPLTQTGMADFVLGRVVIDVAQRKRGKYMAKVQLLDILDMGSFAFPSPL